MDAHGDPAASVDLTGNYSEVLLAGGVFQETVDHELPEDGRDAGLGDEGHLLRLQFAEEFELGGAAGFFGGHEDPWRGAVIPLDAARGNLQSDARVPKGQPLRSTK